MSERPVIAADTIITAHTNADYDALGAMVAASKLYPEAVLILPGGNDRILRDFFMQSAALIFGFRYARDVDLSAVRTLVLVDTRQKGRVTHVTAALDNPDLTIHIYDHHPASADDVHGEMERIEIWGATTSIIIGEIRARGLSLSRDEATIMGLGIYEDTGSFQFPSTTPHDFAAAAFLCEQGMDMNTIREILKPEVTADQVNALHTLLDSATTHEIQGIPIVMAEFTTDEFMGDLAASVHKMMDITQAKVIFAIANMADRVQIVARSQLPEVDVGRICASLGGGGHAGAASASVKNSTMSEVKDSLFALLYSSIKPDFTVGHIMSFPVHSVETSHSVREAEDILLRFGLKIVPVMEPGTRHCVGLLEHQLAARALVHGLGDQIVAEYMQRQLSTVPLGSTLYPVMEIVLGEKQRLVPVVDAADDVVGVISRTDLINILIEEPARIPENLMPESQRGRNIANLIEAHLPTDMVELLKFTGTLGDKLGVNVYMVGGIVRDILMERENYDLDIVVEADGIEFAEHLSRELGGRMRAHDTFKTAVVVVDKDGKHYHIDVATARLEYYDRPAALPVVELSSIKMDLYRRDFTVNALAVHLNSADYGDLEDFFGAQRDLKDHTIRVLHSLSFVEDPTRILRAIRFEQRFGFHLAPQTERLIKNALQLQLFDKLSGSRIDHELQLICEEVSPLACFKRLEGFDALKAVHPLLKLKEDKVALMAEMEKMNAWYDLLYLEPKPRHWLSYLLCFSHKAKYPEVSELLNSLGMSAKVRREFMDTRERVRKALNDLKNWQKQAKDSGKEQISTLYRIFSAIPVEGLLFLMSKYTNEDARKLISHYLTKLRDVKIEINGNDLMELGVEQGPVFSEILRHVLMAKLDGLAETREEQLEVARKYYYPDYNI